MNNQPEVASAEPFKLGLKDKNGVELVEGARVRVTYWHGFQHENVVCYDANYAAWQVGDDLIAEMELRKGTTLEVLPA